MQLQDGLLKVTTEMQTVSEKVTECFSQERQAGQRERETALFGSLFVFRPGARTTSTTRSTCVRRES